MKMPLTPFKFKIQTSKFRIYSACLLSAVFLLLFSCGNNPEKKKREARKNWHAYFFPVLQHTAHHSGFGTDSLNVVFVNKSEYKIESAVLVFRNQGVFVKQADTIFVPALAAKGQFSVPAPRHKMGFTQTVDVLKICSKEMEFYYDSKQAASGSDPYHRK